MANESDHYERVRSVLGRSPGPAGAGPERQVQIQQAKAEGCGGLIEPMQTRPGPGKSAPPPVQCPMLRWLVIDLPDCLRAGGSFQVLRDQRFP